MDKKIEICIGTDRLKSVRARLSLILSEGGKQILEHFHSVSLAPGDDLDATREEVEKHIGNPDGGIPAAPWPKIPDSEWEKVVAVCRIIHT